MFPPDRRAAVPSDTEKPPTLLDIVTVLYGNPGVFEITFWRVRDDAETRIYGFAGEIRARITLAPNTALEQVSGLNTRQLSSAGIVGTGTYHWSTGKHPYYEFHPIEPKLYDQIKEKFPELAIA